MQGKSDSHRIPGVVRMIMADHEIIKLVDVIGDQVINNYFIFDDVPESSKSLVPFGPSIKTDCPQPTLIA